MNRLFKSFGIKAKPVFNNKEGHREWIENFSKEVKRLRKKSFNTVSCRFPSK